MLEAVSETKPELSGRPHAKITERKVFEYDVRLQVNGRKTMWTGGYGKVVGE